MCQSIAQPAGKGVWAEGLSVCLLPVGMCKQLYWNWVSTFSSGIRLEEHWGANGRTLPWQAASQQVHVLAFYFLFNPDFRKVALSSGIWLIYFPKRRLLLWGAKADERILLYRLEYLQPRMQSKDQPLNLFTKLHFIISVCFCTVFNGRRNPGTRWWYSEFYPEIVVFCFKVSQEELGLTWLYSSVKSEMSPLAFEEREWLGKGRRELPTRGAERLISY